MSNEGKRYDAGKLRLDLIPPEATLYLARVLTLGAQKYEARNWELGMDWSRCLGSLKRHLLKWELGQTVDDESGEPHLAHVMWNAMALLVYETRGVGRDDIPLLYCDDEEIAEMFKVVSPLPRAEQPEPPAQPEAAPIKGSSGAPLTGAAAMEFLGSDTSYWTASNCSCCALETPTTKAPGVKE